MTTGEMLKYTNRFNQIVAAKIPVYLKTRALADMMSELESEYEFNEKLEHEQPWVMQLYKTISDARVM